MSSTRTRHVGVDLLIAVAALAFALPLVMTVVLALREGPPGAQTGWTLEGVRALLDGDMVRVILATCAYALAVTVLSTIGAIYFAWLAARTNAWLRWLLPLVMIAIIVTPSLFYAISFDLLASQRTGILNELIRTVTGSSAETGPLDVQSWPGMIVVASIRSIAFSFVLILPAMLRVPQALEEAARLAGAGRVRTLATVVVPVVAPSVLGAAILAAIQSTEAFEVPLILGGPAEKSVLSTEIFALMQRVEGADYGAAAALGLPVMAVIAVLVLWQRRILQNRDFTTVAGKAAGRERVALGRTRPLHTLVILAFVVLALVLPLVQVAQSAFSDRFGEWSNLSTRHLDRINDNPQILSAISNSWWLAVVGGAVVALAAVLMSWVMVRTTPRRSALLSSSVWLVTVLPGILLGVTLFSMVMVLPATRSLFGTVWLLFGAFFIAAMPIAVRAADGPVRQIAPELYEASRVHGAGPVRAWLSTVLPLLPPGLFAAWFVAAVIISSNVAVPLLLSTPQTTLLPVEAMTRYRQGDIGLASTLILINLAAWLTAGALLLALGKLLALRSWVTALVARRTSASVPIPEGALR